MLSTREHVGLLLQNPLFSYTDIACSVGVSPQRVKRIHDCYFAGSVPPLIRRSKFRLPRVEAQPRPLTKKLHPVEYVCWQNIKKRCLNPNHEDYKAYGGRGISICEEWRLSFARFFQDVGARPSPGMSIDRIDNNRGYELGNVHWVTSKQNARNRRDNIVICCDGRSQCISAWAEELGISRSSILGRLKRRLPPSVCLSVNPLR